MALNRAAVAMTANDTCALVVCQALFSLRSRAVTVNRHTNPIKEILYYPHL